MVNLIKNFKELKEVTYENMLERDEKKYRNFIRGLTLFKYLTVDYKKGMFLKRYIHIYNPKASTV